MAHSHFSRLLPNEDIRLQPYSTLVKLKIPMLEVNNDDLSDSAVNSVGARCGGSPVRFPLGPIRLINFYELGVMYSTSELISNSDIYSTGIFLV